MAGPEIVAKDRRGSVRVGVRFPAVISSLAGVVHAEVLDLGQSGMRALVAAPVKVGKSVDVTLKHPDVPEVTLKARVMHAGPVEAGIAFDVKTPAGFEAALNYYESLMVQLPPLAIEVKNTPLVLTDRDRLYPRPLTSQLTAPEQWIYGMCKPGGTPVTELKKGLGGEWEMFSHLPFALLRRGLVGLRPH